jgi:hypothetical protein
MVLVPPSKIAFIRSWVTPGYKGIHPTV